MTAKKKPPETVQSSAPAVETVSKAEAIRLAFSALGESVPVSVVRSWVKEHHGLDVAPTNVYQIKNKAKAGGSVARVPSKKTLPPVNGFTVNDIHEVRGLIDRLGRDGLADLFKALSD